MYSNVKAELEFLRSFMDIGEGTIEASQTEDKDWINNWKQYFHQFYVDDILIKPSWEEVKPEEMMYFFCKKFVPIVLFCFLCILKDNF